MIIHVHVLQRSRQLSIVDFQGLWSSFILFSHFTHLEDPFIQSDLQWRESISAYSATRGMSWFER